MTIDNPQSKFRTSQSDVPQSSLRTPQSDVPQSAIRNPQSEIKVLLVDDSPISLRILQRMLSTAPGIRVVGTAANGLEALVKVRDLKPDVICTDLHMPKMNGLEFTRAVMEQFPRPILVISVSVEPGAPETFRLLEAGALDVMSKPSAFNDNELQKPAKELADKIRILSGVRVIRRSSNYAQPVLKSAAIPVALSRSTSALSIVVIGASTGGPQALREILECLPPTFPLPVICIQHIGKDFLNELVAWLNEASRLPMRLAIAGETAQPGKVYFAPAEANLEWDSYGRFVVNNSQMVDGHCPSVTASMNSAARCFGAGSVGVLLTGMGRDGANGMSSIRAAGGITIAQDEQSCIVYGMPKQAVEQGAVLHILPLDQIASALKTLTGCN